MDIVHEEWRPVVGFEGTYEVSDAGRVRSIARVIARKDGTTARLRERILRQWGSRGYRFVDLCCESRGHSQTVHRIVMQAFVGTRPSGHEVNHKDGNKSNNHLANLEYCTHGENMTHAAETGLWNISGENNLHARYTEEQVRAGHAMLASGTPLDEAAIGCGINRESLRSAVLRGSSWKHLGLAPILRKPRKPQQV